MARSGQSEPVVARWEGGWRATVTSGSFTFSVDEPESAGGTDTAPMPTEYFLGSVASCYALALQWCAAKRNIDLPDLTVSAVGEYDGPRYAEVVLTVRSGLPAEELEPLLTPAARVCYVSNTLAKQPIVRIADD